MLVTAAVVPLASTAVDVGEDVLDAVDDVTDVIEEKVPGGVTINRISDIALWPGRYALKIASRSLRAGQGDVTFRRRN